MFALAAFERVGIVAAILGTVGVVAYSAFKDDEYDTSTYDDQRENEEKAKSEFQSKNKAQKLKDIDNYKRKQKVRIKKKYDQNINFIGYYETSEINGNFINGINYKEKYKVEIVDKKNNDLIKQLEIESNELITLIEELKRMKNESIN